MNLKIIPYITTPDIYSKNSEIEMLSFKTSATRKRQKISISDHVASAAHDSEDDALSDTEVHIEVLRSVEAGELKPLHELQKIQPLVIPVPVARDLEVDTKRVKISQKPTKTIVDSSKVNIHPISSFETDEQRLQKQAELELLNGSVGSAHDATSSSSEPRLVIGQNISEATSDSKKRAPLLSRMVRNANESEEEKFRRDLSSQADDMDFKSSAYRAVPVEQFGLAALRGMGWDGDAPQRQGPQEPMVAREQRLGLGATAAPSKALLQGKVGGAGPRAVAHSGRAPREADRLWMRRVAEEKRAAAAASTAPSSSSSSGLQDGGLAWLRAGEASLAVRLLQVRGVPGLDKIRICELASGAERLVSRRDLSVMTTTEATDAEATAGRDRGGGGDAARGEQDRGRDRDNDKDRKSRDRDRHRDRSRDRDRDQDRDRDRDGDKDSGRSDGRDKEHSDRKHISKDRDRDRDREKGKEKEKERNERDRREKDGRDPSRRDPPKPVDWDWLLPSIRVSVRSSSGSQEAGLVIDVPNRGVASIRLLNGRILSSISAEKLTPVPPVRGTNCMVIRGDMRGEAARLLELSDGIATVELVDDLNILALPLDWLAAI